MIESINEPLSPLDYNFEQSYQKHKFKNALYWAFLNN